MEKNAIEFENVTKSFALKGQLRNAGSWYKMYEEKTNQKRFLVLDDISFSIKQSEVIGLIGLNGTGKTTILRLISNIYKPDSGKIRINGRIAPILEIGTGFNGELNAIDNIMTYGMLLGIKKSEIQSRVNKILEFTELEDFKYMKLKNFSTGMKAKLGFATAIEVDPDILLIDEVLSVGDATFKKRGLETFMQFKEKQKTIVFTSHNMNLIKELSDRVMLINNNKIVKFGPSEEVLPRYKSIINKHEEKRQARYNSQEDED